MPDLPIIPGYAHQVGSHCESGSLRNLLAHAGTPISEAMAFGVGSGIHFYYLFPVRGPAVFPLVALRNKPSQLFRGFGRRTGVAVSVRQARTTTQALAEAERLVDAGTPVAIKVDMFHMRYLPAFLRVHAPFHFIVLVGHAGETWSVSDPYFQTVAPLAREDLVAAWATHAPMAKDNLLAHVAPSPPGRRGPDAARAIDWHRAVKSAIGACCRAMLLPPLVRRLLFFVGVEGIRTYAKEMRRWPDRYRGCTLREGMLFQAIGFEDQGTGGGAFRLMYGAFLHEAAELFGSPALGELAERVIAHGREWRKASRRIIVLARGIPIDDAAYPGWEATHRGDFRAELASIADQFAAFADVEAGIFGDLGGIARGLRG